MTDLSGIILLTLKVAGVGVLGALPLAFVLALVLARGRFAGRAVLSALIMLPLVLPPVVTGLVLLEMFGPKGPLGQFFAQFGLQFGFRWTGAALAAGLVALPLLVRPIRQAFESIDPKLTEAAAVAGLGPVRRLIRLDLPLIVPGLVAGLVLGFAKALGEFGATITFVASIPGETRTLSLAIFSAMQTVGGEQLVLTLSLVSVVISVAAVVTSEVLVARLVRRRSAA